MTGFAPGVLRTDEVLFAHDGVLGRVMLNRPRAINALTDGMVASIAAQLEAWADDADVEVVSIEGAGEKGLCAGGDIRAVREAALTGNADPVDFWRAEYALDESIANFPKSVVAFMDGIVMGGGLGIAAYAGLRLATERSRVAMPETVIGFFPDVGALYLLSRAPGELGTHLALTGASVTGGDAVRLGLADAEVSSAAIPDLIVRLTAGEHLKPSVGDTEPASPLAAQRDWIDRCYAGNDPVKILERLRAHESPAARETADLIARRSPLSVAVTLEAIRRAADLETLRDVLDQDLRLGAHFVQRSDFTEGVRALLVDKDHAPHWRHASLADVSRAEVVAMFGD